MPILWTVAYADESAVPDLAKWKAQKKWLSEQEPSVYAAQMKDDVFVVAEESGVVGWGSLNVAKQEIKNIFVDPVHHRRAIGTAIIEALERRAAEAGLAAVHLQATGTAIEFYLKKGYQSDPPVQPGAQWALMEKSLN